MLTNRVRTLWLTIGRAGLVALLLGLAFNGHLDSAFSQQALNSSAPFAIGEELVYQAEFNKGLLHGVDVAQFRFKAEAERGSSRGAAEEDPVILRLVGDVTSKGLFPRIAGFRFHQHVESKVDPDPFTVLHTNKLDEQGKRVRASEAIFDHEAHRVTWTERDPNQPQPPRVSAADFSEPIQDVLTVIYYLRTQKLEVGKSFEVPVSDSGRVFRFAVAVVERKQIKTVLGLVSAVRVEPALFGDSNLVRSRGSLSIWITEDSRHLPVKAQLKVDIGTFDIKLESVSYSSEKLAR